MHYRQQSNNHTLRQFAYGSSKMRFVLNCFYFSSSVAIVAKFVVAVVGNAEKLLVDPILLSHPFDAYFFICYNISENLISLFNKLYQSDISFSICPLAWLEV